MRKKWNEQMIASDLGEVIAKTGKMPTASALRELGRNDLAIQVGRTGGYISWAKRLGVLRDKSDSDTGWDGEVKLSEKLQENGFTVNRMTAVKAPYDLLVNGVVRVDVKAANYMEYGASRGWFYRIGKNPQADLIALYQLDTGDCYFLPWAQCPTSNVTISRSGGKYLAFKNRYDAVKKLVEYRSEENEVMAELLQ